MGLRRARSVTLLPESGAGGGLREGGGRGSGLAGRGEAGGGPHRLRGALRDPARPLGQPRPGRRLPARPPASSSAAGRRGALAGPSRALPGGESSGRPLGDGRRRSVGTAR